jgi:hypothetical protein
MRIVRIFADSFDLIKDKLLTFDYPVEVFQEMVFDWLVQTPAQTCVLAVVEGNEIEGFLVATAGGDVDFVFVQQAWAAPQQSDLKATEKVFARLAAWADQMGRTSIRMETRRIPEALQRRWGFKVVTTVMQLDIPDYYEAFAAKVLRKPEESDHGERQRNEQGGDGDSRAADRREELLGLPESADRVDGDPLHGGASGESGPAVPEPLPTDSVV